MTRRNLVETKKMMKRKNLRVLRQPHAKAVAKYVEENPEIIQALDAMKRVQLARSLRSSVLDRFSYHSL